MNLELENEVLEYGMCYFFMNNMEDGVMIPKSLFDSFIATLH